MTSLLSSKPIHQIESSLLALFDRTFEKSFQLKTSNVKKELPNRIRQQFGSQTFAVQFDKLITELIRVSILYADGQMGRMQAASVNPSYVLTEEAVRISKDLSKDVGDKIVRLLQDDAIYYEGPAKLAKRVEDLYEGQRYRAMGFTQTFTADVATNTTVQRYRQYGVRYMEFDAELDDRTTDQCRCLDGVVFDLEKTSIDSYRPPLHHRCRSAILPIPITREPDQDMIFENRDFSKAIDNPDEVFKKIEKFNEKYRISQFTLDEDIAARIMMEKGAFVGIEGPALESIVDDTRAKLLNTNRYNIGIVEGQKMDLTITYDGLEVGSIKRVKIIKRIPEKNLALIKVDGKETWIDANSSSIEFSKLHLTPGSKTWSILKSNAFFETAKKQIRESMFDSIRKQKLLSDAEDNYNSGVYIRKKMGLAISDFRKDFETFVKNSGV